MINKYLTCVVILFSASLFCYSQNHEYKVVKTYHIASPGGWDYIAVNKGRLYVSHGTQVKILNDYERRVYIPQTGETRIDHKQTSDDLLNITYDDKPSPYTAISKYWKFIGGDFTGFAAYNLDKVRYWAGRCAILSKNNPVKITGKLVENFGSAAVNINANITYQYNGNNFPVSMAISGAAVNAFTYNCK